MIISNPGALAPSSADTSTLPSLQQEYNENLKAREGRLTLKVVKARLYRDTDLFT